VTVQNSTLNANQAPSGGAVAVIQSTAPSLIEFSTLAGNVGAAGVISSDGLATLRNVIVHGGSGPPCGATSPIVLAGTNFLPDDSCGVPRNGADPLLGPLADNGGPTLTHALLPGSPAINAAPTCAVTTDQRGLPRSSPCDSGSYEFGVTPVPISLIPGFADQGGSAFSLTVSGTGFISGTVALWNGGVRPTTVLNATTLSVAISAADIATAGTAEVQARYGVAADSLSNGLPFTVLAPGQPTPTVTPTPTATLAPGEPTPTPTVTPTIPPGGAPLARLPAAFLNQPID
jgi:hypothetical protein